MGGGAGAVGRELGREGFGVELLFELSLPGASSSPL